MADASLERHRPPCHVAARCRERRQSDRAVSPRVHRSAPAARSRCTETVDVALGTGVVRCRPRPPRAPRPPWAIVPRERLDGRGEVAGAVAPPRREDEHRRLDAAQRALEARGSAGKRGCGRRSRGARAAAATPARRTQQHVLVGTGPSTSPRRASVPGHEPRAVAVSQRRQCDRRRRRAHAVERCEPVLAPRRSRRARRRPRSRAAGLLLLELAHHHGAGARGRRPMHVAHAVAGAVLTDARGTPGRGLAAGPRASPARSSWPVARTAARRAARPTGSTSVAGDSTVHGPPAFRNPERGARAHDAPARSRAGPRRRATRMVETSTRSPARTVATQRSAASSSGSCTSSPRRVAAGPRAPSRRRAPRRPGGPRRGRAARPPRRGSSVPASRGRPAPSRAAWRRARTATPPARSCRGRRARPAPSSRPIARLRRRIASAPARPGSRAAAECSGTGVSSTHAAHDAAPDLGAGAGLPRHDAVGEHRGRQRLHVVGKHVVTRARDGARLGAPGQRDRRSRRRAQRDLRAPRGWPPRAPPRTR